VAEGTSLVAVYRELLVVEDQLAEQLDLLDLVVGRRRQPFERLRLDAVDLGLDLRDLLQRLGRERCTRFLRARALAVLAKVAAAIESSKRGAFILLTPGTVTIAPSADAVA